MSFQIERFPILIASLLSLNLVRRMNKPRKCKETNSKEETDNEIDEFNDNDFDEEDMDQDGVYSNQKGTLNMH